MSFSNNMLLKLTLLCLFILSQYSLYHMLGSNGQYIYLFLLVFYTPFLIASYAFSNFSLIDVHQQRYEAIELKRSHETNNVVYIKKKQPEYNEQSFSIKSLSPSYLFNKFFRTIENNKEDYNVIGNVCYFTIAFYKKYKILLLLLPLLLNLWLIVYVIDVLGKEE